MFLMNSPEIAYATKHFCEIEFPQKPFILVKI